MMTCLCGRVVVLQEVVRHLRRSCHFTRTLQAKDQQVEHQTLALEDEGRELQSTDETESVGMGHV